MVRYLRRWRRWRRSYRGYWTIQQGRLTSGQAAMLRRLRGCETRGKSYWTAYRWDGHHKGAFQYTIGTWARAEAAFGSPRRYRRWSAHVASPAHQDAVTAPFFVNHRSEWACSA